MLRDGAALQDAADSLHRSGWFGRNCCVCQFLTENKVCPEILVNICLIQVDTDE